MTPTPCDTIQTLLSVYADGEASDTEVAQVERHVRECPTCASELAFFQVLRRSPGAPPVMLPPSDLLERIAQQTWARPTWKQRLVAALQPVPVRVAATGAFVALLGFGIVRYLPSPTTQVASTLEPVGTTVPTPDPQMIATPDPWPRKTTPTKPPRVAMRTPAPTAPTPTSHKKVNVGPPQVAVGAGIRPAGMQRTNHDSIGLPPTPAPSPVPDPSTPRMASLDPQAALHAGPNTPSHQVALTGGEATPSTPARTLIASSHGNAGSQDLASAEDDSDARAAYGALLQDQSERSRQSGGVNPGTARGAFSVVQLPANTGNK